MNTRLINRGGIMLPGGYPYVDPKTNMRFDGFEAGGFYDQVAKIIQHRSSNPQLYPPGNPEYLETNFVANQLDEYQCQRFGGDARYCGQTSAEIERAASAQAAGVCQFCGGELEQRYCPTCSGQRVIGTRCKKCGSTL